MRKLFAFVLAALLCTARPAQAALTVTGLNPFTATCTITRPANTTAYAAGQLISTATTGLTTLPSCALGIGNSQIAIINSVYVESNNGAAGTKGQFSLYLFNSGTPSGAGFNDAATFAPTAAAVNAAGNALFGLVPTLLAQTGTANYMYQIKNSSLHVTTDGSGNVYLAVVNNNAYTPASGETITVIVSGVF